jgi:hypothetical protein
MVNEWGDCNLIVNNAGEVMADDYDISDSEGMDDFIYFCPECSDEVSPEDITWEEEDEEENEEENENLANRTRINQDLSSFLPPNIVAHLNQTLPKTEGVSIAFCKKCHELFETKELTDDLCEMCT